MKLPRNTETLICLDCWLIIVIFTSETKAAPIFIEAKATQDSSTYGYLPNIAPGGEKNIRRKMFSAADVEFQTLGGSTITGTMNDETIRRMMLPRCGVEDIMEPEILGRTKRYVLQGAKWDHKNLTYKISKYPTRGLRNRDVKTEIARAFAVWSSHTDLTFEEKGGDVDIEISFESGEHGDGYPFHGSSDTTLAHAFHPKFGGDIHFNDDKFWAINSSYGANFFHTAVHEMGHALGLGHSIQSSVMYKIIDPFDPNFHLDMDDIRGIQAIYGAKTYTADIRICDDPRVDAIFTTGEGKIYAFKGSLYWELTQDGFAPGYPKNIAETWEGLPSNIELAYTGKNGGTHFVKDSMFWSYDGTRIKSGYPKRISYDIFGPSGSSAALKETIAANKLLSSMTIGIYCAADNVATGRNKHFITKFYC